MAWESLRAGVGECAFAWEWVAWTVEQAMVMVNAIYFRTDEWSSPWLGRRIALHCLTCSLVDACSFALAWGGSCVPQRFCQPVYSLSYYYCVYISRDL